MQGGDAAQASTGPAAPRARTASHSDRDTHQQRQVAETAVERILHQDDIGPDAGGFLEGSDQVTDIQRHIHGDPGTHQHHRQERPPDLQPLLERYCFEHASIFS